MTNPIKDCKWVLYPTGDITQHFGQNPKLYESLGIKGHNGTDIVRPWGEHLFAVEDGIVCEVKEDPGGYGMHVRILHDTGKNKEYREWTYGHLSYIHVKLGQKVSEGQYIGNMGNTGFVVSGNTPFWSSNPYAGTHLHIGYRLARLSSTGWKYSFEGSPKIEIVDYNNGYKGQRNVLEFFWKPGKKSTMIRALADIRQNDVLYRLAELMRKIGY